MKTHSYFEARTLNDGPEANAILHLIATACPGGYHSWKMFLDEAMDLAARVHDSIQNVIVDVSQIRIPRGEWMLCGGALHSIRTGIISTERKFALLAGDKLRAGEAVDLIHIFQDLFGKRTIEEAKECLKKDHLQKLDPFAYEIKGRPGSTCAEIEFCLGDTQLKVFPMEALKMDIGKLIAMGVVNIVICTDFERYGESSRNEIRAPIVAWAFKELPELLALELPPEVTVWFADPTLSMVESAADQGWPIYPSAEEANDALMKKIVL